MPDARPSRRTLFEEALESERLLREGYKAMRASLEAAEAEIAVLKERLRIANETIVRLTLGDG